MVFGKWEKHPKTPEEQKELDNKRTPPERKQEIHREARQRSQSSCSEQGCDNDAVSFPSSGSDSRGHCTAHSDSIHGKASPGIE